jgi:hypothetical protein
MTTPLNKWLIQWNSPFQTHEYAPVYLANSVFGGMLDLSGATMDLWSSEIGAVPTVGKLPGGALCPVTALRTQVFYRNDYFRGKNFWVGASGIHCSDARYTADPSMPHLAQVYDCEQKLDLAAGYVDTSGTLALSSSAVVGTATRTEREIKFSTRVIFLKDDPVLGIQVKADAEILFLPEVILREVFSLKGRAKGVLKLGNEIDCDLEVSQEILVHEAKEGSIHYTIKPAGQPPYRVKVRAPGCPVEYVAGHPGLVAHREAFFFIEILPSGYHEGPFLDATEIRNEQSRRWKSFWEQSAVSLPESEVLWQQRYHTSLFYVAQSMGRGAIQPVGLSKPMLPYWFGCFHDTDTYFCRPLLETGHFDLAHRHLAYRQRGLEVAFQYAQEKDRNGALFPWEADSRGIGPSGEVPMNSAIIACEAWHQFLFSGQPEALAAATKIVAAVFANLCDLLDFSGDQVVVRPTEMMTFSETMAAEDATESRIAFRATAAAFLAASQHISQSEERVVWARRILDELELPLEADGSYSFCPAGKPEYQRCPSVTLGSFPLQLLPPEGALAKSFEDELARTIFLFAWLPHQASIVASQLGRRDGPSSAFNILKAANAFYKPWHAYDEWENRRAVRAENFVTAAGGFATAIHHLLAAETKPGIWGVFAAIPPEWTNVSFSLLRLRCGWTLSAEMKDGYTISFRAVPTHSHPNRSCRFLIRNPSESLRQYLLTSGGEVQDDAILLKP